MIVASCLVLLAASLGGEDPTPEQIAAGAQGAPQAAAALTPSEAKFRSISMASGAFRLNGSPYFAIQFKAPSDIAERRLAWGFKRFDFNGWYIVGLDEPIKEGFDSASAEGSYITQTLPGKNLKPGRRYALWFALKSPQNPPLVYSLTLFKNAATGGGHGPKPKLANLGQAEPELAWPPFEVKGGSGSGVDLTDRGKKVINEMADDPEFALRRERGKTIPGDLLAVLAGKPKGEAALNANPSTARYTTWDMSGVTFSHKGRSYCAIEFVPERREGASSSIDYSFVFPTCDAYGFAAGDRDLGTFVVDPPERAGAPQLVTLSISARELEQASKPITLWFRYKPAAKRELLLSLNWLPQQDKILPLLGPQP